jgi:starch phosphorylase
MKVLVNGGLNLSELDGWWAEAYAPEVGWALGDRKEHGKDLNWDRAEANTLYDLLEREVIPEFYTRDSRKVPAVWTKKIQESMARLTPHFSSNRAVREYTEKFYLPGAASYAKRAENNGALAKKIADWELALLQNWNKLGFGELKIQTDKDKHFFEAQVYLNNLDRQAIKVELYSASKTEEMLYQGQIPNSSNGHVYRIEVPSAQPASNFTPRIVPCFAGVATALEISKIVWQR